MKFTPFVVMTLSLGAFVGWIAPDGSSPPARPAAAMQRSLPVQLQSVENSAWNGSEVVLERAPDGHFYAEVLADGGTAHMLVDTGASVVALTTDDASALGVAWDAQAVRPVARGANGIVYGVRVKVDHMQVGDFEAQAVEAIVVPEGLGISLLGQSFLSQIPRVEIDKEKMVLGG